MDEIRHDRAKVHLGPLVGYVFMSEGIDVPCFVPEEFVTFGPDDQPTIDMLGYFVSGWSVRGARWSDSEVRTRHLFPDASRLIADNHAPEILPLRERQHSLAPFPR